MTIGVACGSQVPVGATPPTVLRRSTSTACDEQSGGRADLGGVEVQLGDVARAVGVLGDQLAADRAAVGCLPLRRAGERLHEGVVDAAGEVRVDVVLGEGERAVELRGAGVDLAAEDHRLLQCGHSAGG